MARIRSIHPVLLTDPDWSKLPIPARYMGLLSLMVADDAGNLPRDARFLKMSLFPGDDSMNQKKIVRLTEELLAANFYEPYPANGKEYLHVRSFPKYQKPDRPAINRFPLAPGQVHTYMTRNGNSWILKTTDGTCATNVQRTDSERSEGVRVGIGVGTGIGEGIGLGTGIGLEGSGTQKSKSSTSAFDPLGGQSAVPVGKPKSNRNTTGNPPGVKNFPNTLSAAKLDVYRHAWEQAINYRWDMKKVEANLNDHKFEAHEVGQALDAIVRDTGGLSS